MSFYHVILKTIILGDVSLIFNCLIENYPSWRLVIIRYMTYCINYLIQTISLAAKYLVSDVEAIGNETMTSC